MIRSSIFRKAAQRQGTNELARLVVILLLDRKLVGDAGPVEDLSPDDGRVRLRQATHEDRFFPVRRLMTHDLVVVVVNEGALFHQIHHS